ncbi:MAG: TetR-family transcriptional regulator, partial [Rhizobacter sp.]|nr:TetR-family transcriptional regulator [Rhizobacter sp.]
FHFENKTAIVMALLDVIDKLNVGGLIERVMSAGPSSTDKLVAAMHGQSMLAESKTKYLLLFTLILLEFNGIDSPIERRVRAIYNDFVEALEKIVRNGKAAGDFDADLEAREMAAVIMALQHGTLMEWYCRSDTLNGPGLVRAARVVLLNGILQRRPVVAPAATAPALAQTVAAQDKPSVDSAG